MTGLVEEIAYVQWHRMLFARFLAENHLLMHPSGVAVTLEECAELAPEEGELDAWQLAARYAGAMLPGIFRTGDPAAQVRFAPEGRNALERILSDMAPAVFTADDALGWVYQFWQSKKKDEVNDSGRKIGGADLAPVTQLFTEHYMVQFLLENSLGAWWAARHSDSPLLKQFKYLRFRDDGTPAAGTFPGWPERVSEVTVMDPCCGSGHFLVAAFEMLRRMRMEEEGLSEADAASAVLRDNLFGLELDPRCTQIAAFALAFTAWKAGGYRPLPTLQIACSGIPVAGQLADWTKMAGNDDRLHGALERLYHLFKNAPDLGSLINPADLPLRDRMFTADYSEVEPLLTKALAKERGDDPTAGVFGTAAEGAARAARLLVGKYTLVITNVPYLKRSKQHDTLQQFCDVHYQDSKMDLATAFIERCRQIVRSEGTYAVVTPENWRYLGSYTKLRKYLLADQEFNMIVNLGPKSFQTPMYDFNIGFSILTDRKPDIEGMIAGIEASRPKTVQEKASCLIKADIELFSQHSQINNPDARISLHSQSNTTLLSEYAEAFAGIQTGDYPRYIRQFWELGILTNNWEYYATPSSIGSTDAGRSQIIYWNRGQDPLASEPGAVIRGTSAWGQQGVLVGLMRQLSVTSYIGNKYDQMAAVVIPKNSKYLGAIWAFTSSKEYYATVKLIDKSLKITPATLVKVPFDLKRWQKAAEEMGPLSEPYSNDPTQWLFKGHVVGSTEPLQVAVAKLLGYRWPQQEHDRLEDYADADGIVCLPPVAGEQAAEERLRALLAAAYGDAWSTEQRDRLLAAVGSAGKSLDGWLRDDFFKQHCALFHNRPFIWHIWDGRKDGFSALVNYHKLDAARLNKLIYTYLGTWIAAQRSERDAGVAGADGRLVAALELQKKLEAIRDGEPPYDIYVRWKRLHQQPIGWHPDLNDGVRLNIRPFVKAEVLRSRFTINWNKDRGTNPDGSERLNDLHYTNEEKRRARQQQK
jgi:N-6 DNA Methylase